MIRKQFIETLGPIIVKVCKSEVAVNHRFCGARWVFNILQHLLTCGEEPSKMSVRLFSSFKCAFSFPSHYIG